ncbi:hypothetical protein STEG23_008351 [Scotinomys teguina]
MFEYQTLLEEPQYGENMEIYAGKKNNWTGEFSARFLLKLPVDFSNIPTYLLKVRDWNYTCTSPTVAAEENP